MESCLNGSPRAPADVKLPVVQPTANFHPSLWGDTFLSYVPNESTLCEWKGKAEAMKRDVVKMLTEDRNKRSNTAKLNLIDTIQRLGVAYHFEEQIEEELESMFSEHRDQIHTNDDDLYTVALRFRLLRGHGYNLPCDVFRKFMDDESNFHRSLCDDVDGLVSLYEASHFRVKGEAILDKALNFTSSSLQSLLPSLSPPLAKQVGDALYRPVRKRLLRLEARNYMSIYEENQQHSGVNVVLHFAKLDFNILQKLHQQELATILKWWTDLDCATKFPFARNRIVEDYFWILGMHFEQEFAMGRRFLTKIIAMASVIDDIYDTNIGTKEELHLFTNAVDRWDASAIDDLPMYMKDCYVILLDIFRETEQEMVNQGSSLYGVDCAKEGMKRLLKAYMEERKWVEKRGELPTIEEYKKVALVSSGYPMLSVASLVWMGEVSANDEAFDWMLSEPEIVKAASVIARLMDDIVSYKFEQEREHPPSAVECYAAQYDVSMETACDALRKEVEEAWKDINEAFLKPTPVGKSVLMSILNLARVMDALYKESDGYTHVTPAIKESITSLLLTEVQV